MDELGLKCEVRKVKYRSYKGNVGKTAPNIVDRDFSADRPYQKVATDVTQINIGSSKIYLSPILDMFDGEILTYVISESPNLKMVMDMLIMPALIRMHQHSFWNVDLFIELIQHIHYHFQIRGF